MKRLFIASALIIVFLTYSIAFSATADDFELLFFFSATCPHCRAVEPTVEKISKEFNVRGIYFGKETPQPLPFGTRKGDKEIQAKYGINGVPILVILQNGQVRQTIRGENDILASPKILKAVKRGAVSVSEMVAKGPQSTYNVVGWLTSRGDYFKGAQFYLTDRQQTIRIKPWLPLEVAKSPFRKSRPRLMSDVIDKPVYLEGTLSKTDNNLQFTVGKELTLE